MTKENYLEEHTQSLRRISVPNIQIEIVETNMKMECFDEANEETLDRKQTSDLQGNKIYSSLFYVIKCSLLER